MWKGLGGIGVRGSLWRGNQFKKYKLCEADIAFAEEARNECPHISLYFLKLIIWLVGVVG